MPNPDDRRPDNREVENENLRPAGEGKPPFVAEFDIGVAQVEGEESAARALERAAQLAMNRPAGQIA